MLVFLKFGGYFSYVWGLDFLPLVVSSSYVREFVFLRLGVSNFYLWGLVFLTFGG